MKLTKQKLHEMIEEVINEALEINIGGSEWNKGLSDGKRAALRLLKKREKQTFGGLLNYIDVATEHRSPSYKAGYKLAFELHFSSVLGKPVPAGQLPYANTRGAPRPGFFGFKYEGKNK